MVSPINTLVMKTLLGYCVGIDVSKESLQVCFSAIDTEQAVTVKATSSFTNQVTGFQALLKWVAKHRPEDLPLRYVMESTGVYHEQLAWYLYQQEQAVRILLPNKAKHYLKSLGYKRSDFYGLHKGCCIIFIIFFASLDHRIESMNEFVAHSVEDKHFVLPFFDFSLIIIL